MKFLNPSFLFANTKYKLSESEINFIVIIISKISQTPDADEYFISLEEFNKKEEFKLNLKQFIKKLISKTFELYTKDGFVVFNWLNSIEFIDSKKVFIVNVDTKIKKYLLEFKNNFSNNNLRYILPLTSNYSINIYRFLKENSENSYKSIMLSELMNFLEVSKSLHRYSDFKKKVLEVAQKELLEHTDIYFKIQEIKDGRKVTRLIFNIYKKDDRNIGKKICLVDENKDLFTSKVDKIDKEIIVIKKEEFENEVLPISEETKLINISDANILNQEIKRVVTFFDHERKKLQANYVRKEYKNTDGEYLLRIHLKESNRSPKMFIDAIRWLFSSSPKAEFHRQYIMNIAKLIEHFNTLEHQAMYSKEEIKFNEEAQSWYNVYKKYGYSEEKILEMLKEGGYIK